MHLLLKATSCQFGKVLRHKQIESALDDWRTDQEVFQVLPDEVQEDWSIVQKVFYLRSALSRIWLLTMAKVSKHMSRMSILPTFLNISLPSTSAKIG